MIEYILSFFQNRTLGAIRSPKWEEVRKRHTKSFCEACGSKNGVLNRLNLHHIKPFHLFPELELEPSNFITLCRTCHFLFGHLRSWKSYNVTVLEDARYLLNKINNRP